MADEEDREAKRIRRLVLEVGQSAQQISETVKQTRQIIEQSERILKQSDAAARVLKSRRISN
ncbi:MULTISPECIES: hypothetical protein [unclassified Bradyrhizobium]|jgi:hypothetical protein|uniref:hypothetical protein n=1 Tax=unclassified Bradyrhizobium TaxID=2631580 RepID=UPI001FF72BFC|nr:MULTISPECIES: hypothetical protein [unclassified Bradyrhizobium]MCK1519271.1 hypothetical protein [Bradyrhizobium sp. 17]UPJ70033.1 hypothetical protein IVB19_20125 [Bradyrhizobium sp. 187]